MKFKWILLGWLSLFVVTLPVGTAFAGWPFDVDQQGQDSAPKGDTVYGETADGWKIAFTHFAPAPGTQRKSTPVILCHGFSYNANFWMLDSSTHLPGYLADQGYDVWVPSLRGSGKSSKWVVKLAEVGGGLANLALGGGRKDDPIGMLFGAAKVVQNIGKAELNNASANPKFMNWTYDDYALKDVPTIIDFVKHRTGSDKVHWVGHSMGGNILLCYLTQNPKANKDIASLFTSGSQLTMAKGTAMKRQFENMNAQRLLQLRGNASDLARIKRINEETNNKMFFNLANGDPQIVRRLNEIGLDSPSIGVLGQYMALSDEGKYTSSDKKINYTADAANIAAPAFFSAGGKDNFVSREDLNFLMGNVGSAKKKLQVYSRGEGFRVDYGHNDSFISSAAAQEVYPLVTSWLAENE